MSLLHIENLNVSLKIQNNDALILEQFSLRMAENERLGLVGESGSGKSTLALAIMGLLSNNMKLTADYMNLDGEDLMKMSLEDRRYYISTKASIIFQDPSASLNPCFKISEQINEILSLHEIRGKKLMHQKAIELLDAVAIRHPENVLKMFPYQLSGGMNQRVAIAISMIGNPKLLIADEPTTSLDVTIQAQILKLLFEQKQTSQMGIILITHDFPLLAENTDKIGVIYSGQMMEHASTQNILNHPHHPYSKALLDSIPQMGQRHNKGSRLYALSGQIPSLENIPVGCRLGPRCNKAVKLCVNPPLLKSIENHGKVRCHSPLYEKKEQ
ncbi:MAG: dipeptide ABC transporter ATP-binding protein DppD [Kangiella sp.]|nr:MAG: dipeptide ABC transporter ATP-binding protein DppD [Kangiella sp.]